MPFLGLISLFISIKLKKKRKKKKERHMLLSLDSLKWISAIGIFLTQLKKMPGRAVDKAIKLEIMSSMSRSAKNLF